MLKLSTAGSWPGPNQALWLQTVTFSTPTQVCSGTAVWPTAETMTTPVYAAPPSGRRPAGRSRGPPGAPAPSWRTAVSSGAPHQPEKGAVSESAFGPRGTPWRKPVGPLLTGVLGHRGRLGRAPQTMNSSITVSFIIFHIPTLTKDSEQ